MDVELRSAAGSLSRGHREHVGRERVVRREHRESQTRKALPEEGAILETAYYVPDPAVSGKRAALHYVFELPEWLRPGLSIQEEASGPHYIQRAEHRPDTRVQGEFMLRLDGTMAYYGDDIRRGMLSIEQLRKRFRERNPEVLVRGHAGAGNITMNPFYLGWANGRFGYTDLDVPLLEKRSYGGIIVDMDWTPSFRDDIAFRRGSSWQRPDWRLLLEDRDATDRVRFAIIGPRVVASGKAIDADGLQDQVLEGQHYDLRHAMLFPHLKWPGVDAGDPSRTISFCPMLESMWSQGTLNGGRIRDVFAGQTVDVSAEPYEADDPYVESIGTTIGLQMVLDALISRGYEPVDGEPSTIGEFSLRKAGRYHALRVRIRPGIYSFSALGMKEDGSLLWACSTGLGGRIGITICQMARLLEDAGCHDAVLLDKGGDVALALDDRQIVGSAYGRKTYRGLLLFVSPEGRDEPLGGPEAMALPLRPIAELTSW
jgi:hypothetical protein